MKLRKLEVAGFRAFGSVSIELPESGVVLVAGANNSGKSALLSAIDVVAFGQQYPEQRNYKSGRMPRISATFRLDDVERERLLGQSGENDLIASDGIRDITWELSDQGMGLGVSALTTSWPGRAKARSY